jgi:hypothetical protein
MSPEFYTKDTVNKHIISQSLAGEDYVTIL